MSCTYLPFKESMLNARQTLVDARVIDESDKVLNIQEFTGMVDTLTAQSQKSYGVSKGPLFSAVGDNGNYKAEPNIEAFEAIDQVRVNLGIYDSKESIGSFRQRPSQPNPSELVYQFKAVANVSKNIPIITQWFKQLGNTDKFWSKVQQDLQVPKDQIKLLRESEGNNIEEKLASFVANYSYTVEINTATDKESTWDMRAEPTNAKYYSNLTVPGGTNYTEQEIATPAITPSIKGHAQFATDKGIGWFRSDEKSQVGDNNIFDTQTGEWSPNEVGSKTRRILEVQSDLFQKGRNRDDLAKVTDEQIEEFRKLRDNVSYEEAKNYLNNIRENQFLQLLNKDNNWVTFFVKSIIQDSAKNGYEKVLFPTGNTASKVEDRKSTRLN